MARTPRTVESAAPLVSPAYDLGLTVDEVVDRSLRRLERIYAIRIASATNEQ